MDELLIELRKLGIGCKVAGVHMGAVGFCDDMLLMAPTRDGMQVMLDTCQRFALKNNLMFSTDPNPEKRQSESLFVEGRKICRSQSPCSWMGSYCHGLSQLFTLETTFMNLDQWIRMLK